MKIYATKNNGNYLFTVNDEIIFSARFSMRFFKQVKYLYQGTKLISEIKFSFRLPFKLIHNIKHFDKNHFKLEFNNPFSPKHTCIVNNDIYDLVPHKGIKTSIFKNGSQIGFYEENRFELFGRQTILIVVDDDVEIELICTFILAVKCDFRDDDSTVSIDLGNFGPEIKAFDNSWKPNVK